LGDSRPRFVPLVLFRAMPGSGSGVRCRPRPFPAPRGFRNPARRGAAVSPQAIRGQTAGQASLSSSPRAAGHQRVRRRSPGNPGVSLNRWA